MIILFLAIGGLLYFGCDYMFRAYLKRQAREMTDERLREESDRAPAYSAYANICFDELARREEVKAMLWRAQ